MSEFLDELARSMAKPMPRAEGRIASGVVAGAEAVLELAGGREAERR
jgi:hypothetical protein